jgi:prepilin-type N-terminal cleavage/methylation domain-containing protein
MRHERPAITPGRMTETSDSGFSLLEVLVVVAILGIAAALVVPQIGQATGMQAQAAARMVISDLTFAQNQAIAEQSSRQVIFDIDHNRYTLADGDGAALNATWMNGPYTVAFDADRRFSDVALLRADFDGAASVRFDDLGTPDNGGTVELQAGGSRYRITVAAFTGRITVAQVTGG